MQGFFPICDNVIYVIVRLQVPLCKSPMPIKAEVCTLIGIYRSTPRGNKTGICKIRVFESD